MRTRIKTIIAGLEAQRRALSRLVTELREVERSAAAAEKRPATLEEHERELIAAALKRSLGNQTDAAAALGIGRDALRYKMRKYKLNFRERQ